MADVEAEIDQGQDLDESQFQQYETGELNLPSDKEDSDDESEIVDSDNDLDEYYRELGIDPEEMKPQKTSAKTAKPKSSTAEYTVREKREAPEQVIQRQRSELLNKMMERARSQPNYKILNRII